MNEYELIKTSTRLSTPPYRIKVETEDIDFLNFMDKKIDELLKEYYNED